MYGEGVMIFPGGVIRWLRWNEGGVDSGVGGRRLRQESEGGRAMPGDLFRVESGVEPLPGSDTGSFFILSLLESDKMDKKSNC